MPESWALRAGHKVGEVAAVIGAAAAVGVALLGVFAFFVVVYIGIPVGFVALLFGAARWLWTR